MLFLDRVDAGRQLATHFRQLANRNDIVVLALPRGGIPVGAQIADALSVPLDVFVVRKLGVPGREELAMGAIASGGIRVLNRNVIDSMAITDEQIESVTRNEEGELRRREQLYRNGSAGPQIESKTIILVDDGLATGSTMMAAVEAARKLNPARIVVAVPVGAADTCDVIAKVADEVHCLEMPASFGGVGQWYGDFSQVSDAEASRWIRQLGERKNK